MTYIELAKIERDGNSGYMCSQDGLFILDVEQHTQWHEYLESRLQLHGQRLLETEEELSQTRQELTEADLLSQGVSERAAAAVRYAEAARTYFKDLVVSPGERQALMNELKAAGNLWEHLR